MMLALAFVSQSWQPVLVSPASMPGAKEPQIAIDVDYKVYVAYGSGDTLYLSISTDRGATFAEPSVIGSGGKLSLGMRRGPRISAVKGVITVSAIFGAKGGGADGDLCAFRSGDGGKTWKGPFRVNDVDGSAREGLHAMAVAPDGTLACTWLDLRAEGTQLFVSSSKDGGESWSANRLVYASPSGSVCECCHPSMAFDRKGKLFVMFRNSLQGARDMFLTVSTDLSSFAPPVKLGSGTWTLAACPMDGGMLAVNDAGSVAAVWRRRERLYVSGDQVEREFHEGRNPWISVGTGGEYTVWQAGREVRVSIGERPARVLAERGSDPVVASSPDGNLVVAAWNQQGVRAMRLSP